MELYRIINANAHMSEPFDMWASRTNPNFAIRRHDWSATTLFPHSQDILQQDFTGMAEVDKHKILYTDAAKLYGFNTPNQTI